MKHLALGWTVTLTLSAGSLLAGGCGGGAIQQGTTQPAVEASPHSEALRLVFERCADQIRAVDQEHWWFDTKRRSWNVHRFISPGWMDTTHVFDVTYEIDGKEAAGWQVNTRRGIVKNFGEPGGIPVD